MDEVQRLIDRFEDEASDVAWRRDALLDLVQVHDPRILPCLLRALANPAESNGLRREVLTRLPIGAGVRDGRPEVARTLLGVAQETPTRDNDELRAEAAVALGECVDVGGVIRALGDLALNPTERFDVRYAAFTSLQRGGPTPESIALFNQLAQDDTLGRAAASILVRWHVE